MIGSTLDRYRLLEKLGAGGMGEVYRARDERLQRDVALKVLPPGTLTDSQTRQRFRQEALTLSRLNHPHVATLHDFATQDGVDFLVMEYVPGVSLADRLEQGALPEKEVVKLGIQVATALSEAHEQGVVHRDLKPGNIMVTPKAQVKVLDFGLAKLVFHEPEAAGDTTSDLTEHKVAAGTLPYMAPEQLTGEGVDPRTDIYALGVVLYEMTTGQRPFRETLASKMIDCILHQAPVPPRALNPRISPELERITVKCLEKSPENRYQAAVEVAVDLRRLEASASGVTIPQVPVRRRTPKKTTMWATTAVAGVLLTAVALNVGRLRDRIFGTPAGRIERIAVLPITAPAGDTEQEIFADGMTTELISELSHIRALSMIPRSSVMRYRGTKKSVPEIASELKVQAVLVATVLVSNNRVRISAELVRTQTDTVLWSGTYERDLRDILSLQRELASAVAGEVRAALTPPEAARLAQQTRVNPKAFLATARGRRHWDQRKQEDLTKALASFQEAIAADPSYAPAYVGLADTYLVLWGNALLAPERAYPLAKAAAENALELDESSAEAHASLASIHFFHYEWADAEREFRRAIELNPGYAIAHHWYALLLSAQGRHPEAISQIKRAQEVDPLSLSITANTGWCYYLAGQYDQVIEQARHALDLEPNFDVAYGYMGQAYVEKGMAKEALEALTKARELAGEGASYHAELGNAYAVFGKKNEALRLLNELKEHSRRESVAAYNVAMIYAGLGENTQALNWLEKSYENREGQLVNVAVHPRFAHLRNEPRFVSLLRRMGLAR